MKDLLVSAADTSSPWRIPHFPLIKMPSFGFHCKADDETRLVEAYIQKRFYHAHQAQVSYFLPNLISMSCQANYTAAVGIAPAGGATLFAEVYLSQPIELAISNHLGVEVRRDAIVEVGNLVSSWKGSSILLFIFLGELIERLGFHWVLFTATQEVERLLARMHYTPIVIAEASPHVLTDGGASWGNYYQHHPRVMFGDVRTAIKLARSNPLYRAAVALINQQIEEVCAQYRRINHLPAAGERHE